MGGEQKRKKMRKTLGSEMAQWVEALAVEPKGLSSILRTHKVESQLLQVAL